MKKKVISTIICAAMAVSMLVGCGAKEEAKAPAEETKQEEPAKEEKKEEPKQEEKKEEPKEEVKEEAKGDVLAGGGSNIIYIITPSQSNVFFKTEAEVSASEAKSLGYEAKIMSHDDDATKQMQQFEAAIADKAAAIICDNAGADATIEAVKLARAAGIPTFLIDREINEEGVAISQIVANNYQGAKAVAEEWVEAMGEEGKYVELLGKESDTNAGVRSAAFHEVIDQYPDLEMVAQQSANWDQNEAYEKMGTILQSNPKIDGVICGNDTMLCGAIAALEDAGLAGIPVIGVDGSDDARDMIIAGKATATALQQAAEISRMAVRQANDYLKNGSTGLDEKQLVDCVAITKDNAQNLQAFDLAK